MDPFNARERERGGDARPHIEFAASMLSARAPRPVPPPQTNRAFIDNFN